MRFIATTSQIRSQPFRFIPFVHAQPEPLARSARLEGIERIRQLYVVRICSGGNQCKRKPVPVSHQTALYAPFPPVCWVLACFLSLPAVIWSYKHPSTATTSVNTPFITQSSRRIFMPHFGTQMASCH